MKNKTEYPILFNGKMVRAILDGRKTQTRRVVKPQPPIDCDVWSGWIIDSTAKKEIGTASWTDVPGVLFNKEHIVKCPYGKIGDLLWVRESLQRYRRLEFLEEKNYNNIPDYLNSPNYFGEESVKKENQKWTTQYIATGTAVPYAPGAKRGWCGTALWEWKNKSLSPIHMPRWACRLLLEITNIRVERLQDIGEEDSKAEGMEPWEPRDEELRVIDRQVREKNGWGPSYRNSFHDSWDLINTERGYSWDSNPWVWVVEFKEKSKSYWVDSAQGE
jgi:hypothetical protein